MGLSDKAILVHLSISQWTGRKKDKKATSTVEESYSTKKHVGNFTKKLLPAAKELESIQSLAGSIRTFFVEQTLPWMSDGTRILSSKNYIDFIREYQTMKNKFESRVENFLIEYPKLVLESKIELGNLFDSNEYPSTEKLRHLFSCDVIFSPLPDVKDFRVEILDSEKNVFLNKMRDVETEATQDCFRRLVDTTKKAIERLNTPDAILRDSLLENILEVTQLLPKLNVTENQDLENSRAEIEKLVLGLSTQKLRENSTERQNAAQKLREATNKMNQYMGVN